MIVDVREARPGELIVQPVIPATMAENVDFHGVGPFAVPLGLSLRAGAASGEEFRHDDDDFPDPDRRNRQHPGGLN